MDALDGYLMSKGAKAAEPRKPSVDDVRRWKRMMDEASGD